MSANRAPVMVMPPVNRSECQIPIKLQIGINSNEDLLDALAMRGLSLATVSGNEARQSERTAAFAEEVGNFSRVLREGEIVAVNDRGHVQPLNSRNTGDQPLEIEARLAGIDRAGLLNVADTKDALQEASRTAFFDHQRAEVEKGRPPTRVETMIAEALTSTMTGYEFAETLDHAGLTITRVSAADVQSLDAQRLAGQMKDTGDRSDGRDARDPLKHLSRLHEGDFAAVTRRGDVFRLSPQKLDFKEIDQRLSDTQPRLPSVVEAQALNLLNREQKAALWEQHQAFSFQRSMLGLEIHVGLGTRDHLTRNFKEDVSDARDALIDVGSSGINAIGRGLMKVATAALDFLEGLFSPPPRLTRDQAERREQAAEETAQHNTERAQVAEQESALDAVNDRINEQNLERDPDFYNRFPGLTRPVDQERDRDRERERER